ncbi:MAG: phenylalanine--tRNA ligase subunit beta [Verrucomicrobia bacterium]|nr:phenylalanine--tRNA ligase subunit beta [Verrucomicrobiota bacterium]
MKVTLNWLKQYVDFTWSPDELTERLTLLGLEVEGVEKLGGEFAGVVVAQVITRDKHPNADKLSVCRVNDGQGERQIVCGAQNFQAGDKVPLALPGAVMATPPGQPPFVIKVGKIRGVESHGMMCSPKELGLAEDAQGLMILPADAQVGQPFAEFLGRAGSDVVYDLEITPNRPDLNSLIGIAREISAATGNPLKVPECGMRNAECGMPKAADLVAVRIDDADLCPRYTARVVRGVKIGPSPDWLRSALEKVGLRSINNVVDVTNYVMLECGQPLHAFDYHLIAKNPVEGLKSERVEEGTSATVTAPSALQPFNSSPPTIVIRRARDGEKFTTLDRQEHTLTCENLLIADEAKGIALAGVMGGLNSEINSQSVDVLIESAYFDPANVRRTSKTLGLRTDASYRFERGADIGASDWASRRCAQLILETAGGTLADGIVDAYPNPVPPKQITLRHHKVNELLGIQLRPEEIEYFLGQLGLKVVNRKARPVGVEAPAEPVTFQVPTFRVDLKRETDLIEEVARLYGVDKIPSTPPRGAIGTNEFDPVCDTLGEARRILAGLGLNEAQGQTLIAEAAARFTVPAESLVMLANPLSADMNALRPSLLPGLLDSLRHNLTRKVNDVALFELGRIFSQNGGRTKEERRVALALTGQRAASFWKGEDREAKFDLSDLKGFVEEFLEQFGLRGVTYARRPDSTTLFLESATVQLGGKLPLGELGQVSPVIAKQYDLRDPVWLAELNLDQLLARRNPVKSFKPLPQFPPIRRDVAMLVPEAVTHDAVLAAVKQAKLPNLEAVELFDVFRGQNVPEGQKSLAYAFTYRHAERTLTDAEVNAAHEKLVTQFRQSLQAVVRES